MLLTSNSKADSDTESLLWVADNAVSMSLMIMSAIFSTSVMVLGGTLTRSTVVLGSFGREHNRLSWRHIVCSVWKRTADTHVQVQEVPTWDDQLELALPHHVFPMERPRRAAIVTVAPFWMFSIMSSTTSSSAVALYLTSSEIFVAITQPETAPAFWVLRASLIATSAVGGGGGGGWGWRGRSQPIVGVLGVKRMNSV